MARRVNKPMTSAEGKRMRCIRGAYAAHRSMLAQGRTPGEEGRSVIMWNRLARKRDKEEGKGWRVGHTILKESRVKGSSGGGGL